MDTKTSLLIELLEKNSKLGEENFLQLVTISELQEEIDTLKAKIERLEDELTYLEEEPDPYADRGLRQSDFI